MKNTLLKLSKDLGLIALSKRVHQHKLNILCYHGIAKKDEHQWMPSLFINQEDFRKRMQFIKENYHVISLDEGVRRLKENTLDKHSVVITFDDGFDNFYTHAWPIIQDLDLPATLYLTSYYALKQTPIFRLALNYMLWQKRGEHILLDALHSAPGLSLAGIVPLEEHQSFFWPIVEYAEKNLSDQCRTNLLQEIAEQLQLDTKVFMEDRLFHIVDRRQLLTMMKAGLDVQLHSHRHVTPTNEYDLWIEIEQNRRYINADKALNHYCYPSGIYSDYHPSLLRNVGVVSATTCDRGLNSPKDNPLALKRFMDGAQLDFLEFEAELSGLMPAMSRMLSGCALYLSV